jgi:SAM-dependent methyltransferase
MSTVLANRDRKEADPNPRNSVPPRQPYQGVLQILRFNRRFYAGTLAAVTAAFLIAALLPAPWHTFLRIAALPALFWMSSSLLVSHYIYDRSPLYDLTWLAKRLAQPPQRWVNIHAGLDETSHLITALFPQSQGCVLDIYDPTEMPERSIAEARRGTCCQAPCVSLGLLSAKEEPCSARLGFSEGDGAVCSPAKAETTLGFAGLAARATWSTLPLPSRTLDTVFLIFTAHELRRPAARVQFFRELARVLRPDGEVALIEHARDWRNFLAFGPGFLHFFSPRSWRQTARAAGFVVRTEFRFTPFVEVLILRNTL